MGGRISRSRKGCDGPRAISVVDGLTHRPSVASVRAEPSHGTQRRDQGLRGGLGTFVELEVVLADDEPTERGVAEAHALMERLGIAAAQLVEAAYVDLLA